MKTKLENNFEEIFDLPDSPPIAKPKLEVIPKSNNNTIDNDYQYARENLYGLIENGSNALNSLVEIAQASEHPRAFEVVGSLIKTLSDANKDLIEISNKVKKIKEETKSTTVTNNSLFVGSTAELQQLLKNNGR